MPLRLEETRLNFSNQEFIEEGNACLVQNPMLIIFQALCSLCTHVNEPDELNKLPEFNVLVAFLLAVHLADLLEQIKLSHVPWVIVLRVLSGHIDICEKFNLPRQGWEVEAELGHNDLCHFGLLSDEKTQLLVLDLELG